MRYLIFGAIGLVLMRVLARGGLQLLNERVAKLMLIGSVALLLLVLAPGFGIDVNGARRWFAAGPIQFQPSEVAKLALVVYVATIWPRTRSGSTAQGMVPLIAPIAIAAGPACLLVLVEPDMGTALVVVFRSRRCSWPPGCHSASSPYWRHWRRHRVLFVSRSPISERG